MPNITLTSIRLESFGRNKNRGVAQFSASWNAKVADAMGWTDIPECLTGTKLEGDLAATTVELKPTAVDLRKHSFELAVNRVFRFETIRLEIEGRKGKGHRTELRFKVLFSDLNGCQNLERFLLSVGAEKSTAVISYDLKAKQQDLIPDVYATDDQKQAAMDMKEFLA